MNIVFFGTNNDGSIFLRKLIRDFSIKIVVTNLIINDNWRWFLNRCVLGKKLTEDIVRWKPGVILVDQERITQEKFINVLKESNIDLGVIASFSKIIPKSVIDAVHLGIINVHPSLLPKYRGANPIFWSLRNGEKEFGVTVHYINERIDAGDIIMKKKIKIEDNETLMDCKKKFFEHGIYLMKKSIKMIESGKVKTLSQKEDESTYYPPAKKEYRTILPNEHNYFQVKNIMRASMGKKGATVWYQGKKICAKSIVKHKPRKRNFIEIQVKDGRYFLLY